MCKKERLLLDILYHLPSVDKNFGIINRILNEFPDSMPDKGYGHISVDDTQKAELLLKEHVGEHEWGYYPFNAKQSNKTIFSFIQKHDEQHPVYYGKFEIENLQEFFVKLYKSGVRIHDYNFHHELNY
jgi:hypothetical protein